MELRGKVINAYAEGSDINFMAECFGITPQEVLNELRQFKEDSVYKRTFKDEFKIMIAERDMRKITRTSIAEDLQLNVATVKNACEKFGNAIKEFASNDNLYEKVEGATSIKTCPNCKSSKVNAIDSAFHNIVVDGIFCMDCGNEYLQVDTYEKEELISSDVYKVNFEYLDE
ncbi:DNA-binding protein [Bacillus phage vB_BanS-Thrax4]|nr:DNA-binding protein [Bacillus phage vB_BanS-Thrax4]